jgi:ethanolamine utilization cobalamin adenosyltransferase
MKTIYTHVLLQTTESYIAELETQLDSALAATVAAELETAELTQLLLTQQEAMLDVYTNIVKNEDFKWQLDADHCLTIRF